MSSDGVPLRLYRGHKLVREWTADIPLDDAEALAGAFLAAVRIVTATRSNDEAKILAPDYRLEYWARVGGWTRHSPEELMTRTGRSLSRAERAAARRQSFYQARIDEAAAPAATFSVGADYLLSVLRRLEIVNPRKAQQVAADTTEFLLKQANAHDMTTTGGRR